METNLLKNLSVAEVLAAKRAAVAPETLTRAAEIIAEVRGRGREAVLDYGQRFGDLGPAGKLTYTTGDLQAAAARLPAEQHALLSRTSARIAAFARAQREGLQDLALEIPGGRAGWRYLPVGRAGCYAPGGRFPLPSSVLMTVVTARQAGVEEVWVASPRPGMLTLAAAAIAGADAVLAAGGAQAITALAYGIDGVPACDVIVGPGNRYVTAAKQLVVGQVGIDMLAGPSELVILADATACPTMVAADLLAQAEHDPDAVPLLVTTTPDLGARVAQELEVQLTDLPTAATARQALANGGVVVTANLDQAIDVCNALGPEHLEVLISDPARVVNHLRTYGALFLGAAAAEVLGDYGAGPNHVLPTGGTARFSSPLSVQDFLVGRSWLEMHTGPPAAAVTQDAVALARLEGLEAHARSAEKRLA